MSVFLLCFCRQIRRREEILAVPSSPSSSKRKNKNKAGSSVGEEELKKKSYENLELRFTEGECAVMTFQLAVLSFAVTHKIREKKPTKPVLYIFFLHI